MHYNSLSTYIHTFHVVSLLSESERRKNLEILRDRKDISYLSVEDILAIMARPVANWVNNYRWVTSNFRDLGLEDLYNSAMAEIAFLVPYFDESKSSFYSLAYGRVKYLILGEVRARVCKKRGVISVSWKCSCGKIQDTELVCSECGEELGEEATLVQSIVPDILLSTPLSLSEEEEKLDYYDVVEDTSVSNERDLVLACLIREVRDRVRKLQSYSGHDLVKVFDLYIKGATTKEIAVACGMVPHLMCKKCGTKIIKNPPSLLKDVKECPSCGNKGLIKKGTTYLHSMGGNIVRGQLLDKLKFYYPEVDEILEEIKNCVQEGSSPSKALELVYERE